ncbi:MAG: hypothetical protein AAFR77_22610, partial [Cyanobacteria bacterium J06631_2]
RRKEGTSEPETSEVKTSEVETVAVIETTAAVEQQKQTAKEISELEEKTEVASIAEAPEFNQPIEQNRVPRVLPIVQQTPSSKD